MTELEKEYDKHKIPIIGIVEQLTDNHNMVKKKAYAFIDQMNDEGIISNNGESFVRLSKYA